MRRKKRYSHSTIKRGKVKVTSQKQHKFLEVHKMPHTHVYTDGSRKRVYSKRG